MRKIIVLGAGGTAGRMISAEAHERGHDVTGVLRDPARAAEPPPSGVTIVAGDATDKESVQDLVGGADAVVVAIGGPERTLWREAAETLAEAIATLPEPRPRRVLTGGSTCRCPPSISIALLTFSGELSRIGFGRRRRGRCAVGFRGEDAYGDRDDRCSCPSVG
jgi:hypothetical protein